jgi:hypothetical protein
MPYDVGETGGKAPVNFRDVQDGSKLLSGFPWPINFKPKEIK